VVTWANDLRGREIKQMVLHKLNACQRGRVISFNQITASPSNVSGENYDYVSGSSASMVRTRSWLGTP